MDSLFNSKPVGPNTQILLEQYKMYLEMADRVSQRRGSANTFFITINAAILTISSWSAEKFGSLIYIISIVGILLCISWFFAIRSYRQLNSGKFKVIHEIEKELPLNLYQFEWLILKEGKSFKDYWPLSHIECFVPVVFSIFYVILLIIVSKNGGL